jgi:uncharacterized protein (TIGR02246 family)
MSADEQAIRDFLPKWFAATERNDSESQLAMLADDIVFLTPNGPPFGKKEFAAMKMEAMTIKASGDFEEVIISGDMACTRGYITVTVTPKAGGSANKLAGYILSVFRKQADGQWLLSRDANFVKPVP